ncbi:MAG: type II toxin-antitoxin system HicB family antitoxin [Reyranella sp.]|nr:type II toxin-antitoxin system HicB family antitoxin [Reyranella sp.]
MLLKAALIPASEGGYTAANSETGTTSRGETIEETMANLREATALCLEGFPLPASTGRSLITTFEVAVSD